MKRPPRRRLTLVGIVLALPVACQRPEPPTEPTAAEAAGEELDALWDASLAVLLRHDFQPDRQDRAQGVITTFPSTSRQWGEFWRQDTADSYSFAESSLQTIQRQATIRFTRGAGKWTVAVEVQVFRLSELESQITTASAALQAFSGVLPTSEGGLTLAGPQRKDWTPLGRDGAMESRLLGRILDRAGSF